MIQSLLISSFLRSNYSIENAFPNLSFNDPVGIYNSGDGSNRLFVVEQPGVIKVFNNYQTVENVSIFLDIESIVDQDGGYTEEGLLGLAFHPNFTENGFFYVNYTDHNPRRNVIARYRVSDDNPDEADYSSSLIIMEVGQPFTNHNGGQIDFGPDGFLYISFGDGGSAGDPLGHGQNLTTLLGSLIRIDIDNPSSGMNYSIPTDNPFVDILSARGEIYAYGLRNMWRFSWDSITGNLWGADVGQYEFEEINIIESGKNYGWNTMEGSSCYNNQNCNTEGLQVPVWEYELYVDGVCSITGGYVYRGYNIPSLYGKYIYGDWCTGDIWALMYSDDGNHLNEDISQSGINITSFGIDENQELLICANSNIYKIISDESPGQLGDLNQDGQINIQDIILNINIILGADATNYEIWSGDLNQDSIIDVLDIVLLINLVLS